VKVRKYRGLTAFTREEIGGYEIVPVVVLDRL
jgi:hypothetical protein